MAVASKIFEIYTFCQPLSLQALAHRSNSRLWAVKVDIYRNSIFRSFSGDQLPNCEVLISRCPGPK